MNADQNANRNPDATPSQAPAFDPASPHDTAEDLLAILAILRDAEHGCPWDKVQTHASIRMNFLEETYEAMDAIDLDDPELLCEELGDVLMQVAFHTSIEQDAGRFTWQQVCAGVCRKLIDRHPNIFGDAAVKDSIKDWDALKNEEKGRVTIQQDLQSVPQAMPALMRAAKLQKRAARYGVVQSPAAGTVAQAAGALAEAPDPQQAQQAAGELLFAAVALAAAAGVNPEQALQQRCAAFVASAPTQTPIK